MKTMVDEAILTKSLWCYNVALCCNERAVKKGVTIWNGLLRGMRWS